MGPSAWPKIALLLMMAADPTAQAPLLSLSQALQQGVSSQPRLHLAQAQSDAGAAGLLQARAPLIPALGGMATYQRTTTNFVFRPGFVVNTANQRPIPLSNASADFWNVGLTASWLVYDFDRSWGALRAARHSFAGLERDRVGIAVDVAYQIRSAYFAAYAKQALVIVSQQNLANQRKHCRQIEGYIAVGTRAAIDLAQARTEVANANVTLIAAQNDFDNARLLLNQAMGVEEPTVYRLASEVVPPLPQEQQSGTNLVDEALRARPEYLSLDARILAAQAQVQSQLGSYFPSLALGATFTDAGASLTRLGWNWNVSATLNWDIFAGGATRGQVRAAQAQVRSLLAQRDQLRQQVRVEVEQARFAIGAAQQTQSAAAEALHNAQLLLRSAEGRYATGVGNVIELGDAQVALTGAAAQQVQAVYQLASARAALRRALGLS